MRHGTGEYDQAALIPFQLPVCGDGDFGDDEGMAEGGKSNGRGCDVAGWGLTPEFGVGGGFEGEVFHASGKGKGWWEVEGCKRRTVWCHFLAFVFFLRLSNS